MASIRTRIMTRRTVARVVFAALLGTIAVGLSQCTLVNDRLTGVRVSTSRTAASSCLTDCQKAAKDATQAENALHVSRLKACGSNVPCITAEQARHVQALRAIGAAREACMNGCHSQGLGRGGE